MPPTPRQAASDTLHGASVPDPYRWLEDAEAPSTVEWVAQQNERTRQALDAQPSRARWHERLVALMRLPVVMQAKVRGDQLFVLERAHGAEQYSLVLRSASNADAAARLLVDPGPRSADAATAIEFFEPSDDGRFVAYGVSEAGTEDATLSILDTETGEHLDDSITNMRGGGLAWLPDASGFYYAAYPVGDHYNRRILFHVVGTDPGEDEEIWHDPATPQAWPDVHVSPDGRYLLVDVMVGWGQIDAFLLDRDTGEWTTVVTDREATSLFTFIEHDLLISTTLDAPRGRVVRAPLTSPGVEHWRTVVGEGPDVIGRAYAASNEILVTVTHRAVDRVDRFTLDGTPAGPVGDLGVVSVLAVATSATSNVAFIVAAGFDTPAALHRYAPAESIMRWTPEAPSDRDVPPLRVTQARYRSKDGTEIGAFVIHRRDMQPNPSTPAILNGYGGFAITETPVWSPTIAAWCAQGGLYVIAGLRGGLEEGEPWHHAGRRANKQNVFDDFHAAADWLVESEQTSRHRLAIAGGSNGGLLVGVALTQRPDLCRAVWCAVPLLDMIRYPNFLVARLWTDEYGDPDVEEEFRWLWAYSPYHHVRRGTEYPAVLLTTAEGDGRVDPLHARKMAAELQWAAAGQDERPILLHQEGRAGHGVGKPASKRADEFADVLTFFTWQLGLEQ